MKLPVIKNPNFIVYTEDVQGLTFIHMDVFKWTTKIKKDFLNNWLTWANIQNKPLYAMPFIDDSKMAKWAVICGFRVIEHHECLDGVTRKLYIWSK